MKRALLILTMTALAAGFCPAQAKEPRFALVIGNGGYPADRLKNPANDAQDMAQALRELGFTVELLIDAELGQMEQAAVRLGSQLAGSSDAVGFFYYAGHGVQSEGSNYLIPVNTAIPDESFLRQKSLALESVLSTLQRAKNRLSVVVLDACRNNPFPWNRGGTRGLAVVGRQPSGSMIVYATSAESVAKDGAGRNGVFTGELLKHLKTPALEIEEMFRLTSKAVQTSTGGDQVPAIYDQYHDKYYLAGAPAAAPLGDGRMTVVPDSGTIRVTVQTSGRVYVEGIDKGEITPGAVGTISAVQTGTRTVEMRYADGKTERTTVPVEKDRAVDASFTYRPPPPAAPAPAKPLVTTPSSPPPSAAGASAPGTLKIGCLAPSGSPLVTALESIARKWQSLTDGRVRLIVYAGATMGSEADMLRKVRIGQLHGALLSFAALASVDPAFSVYEVPFLIQTDEEFESLSARLLAGAESRLAQKGFKEVASGNLGWSHLFSRAVINTPDDLLRQRLAVTLESPLNDVMRASGFRSVPLDLRQILEGLQSGMVDAVVASPLDAVAGQWFALAPHMTSFRWFPSPGALVFAARAWQELPASSRDTLEQAAQEIIGEALPKIQKAEAEALQLMRKYGLKTQDMAPSQVWAKWGFLMDSSIQHLKAGAAWSTLDDEGRQGIESLLSKKAAIR